jgi:hypothetical protein
MEQEMSEVDIPDNAFDEISASGLRLDDYQREECCGLITLYGNLWFDDYTDRPGEAKRLDKLAKTLEKTIRAVEELRWGRRRPGSRLRRQKSRIGETERAATTLPRCCRGLPNAVAKG